jgi:hypothetical protein
MVTFSHAVRAPAGRDVVIRAHRETDIDPPYGIVIAIRWPMRLGREIRLVTDLPPLDELTALGCHWDDLRTVLWTYEIDPAAFGLRDDTPWQLAEWAEGRGPWAGARAVA